MNNHKEINGRPSWSTQIPFDVVGADELINEAMSPECEQLELNFDLKCVQNRPLVQIVCGVWMNSEF